MREAQAQAVVLVRAFEEADPQGRVLPAHDRAAATEAARAAGGDDETVLAARAASLLPALEGAVPGLPRLLAATRFLAGLGPVVVGAAFVLGLATNVLGPERHVSVLQKPFLLVFAWNLAVYVAWAAWALAPHRARAAADATGPAPSGRLAGLALRVYDRAVARFSRGEARRRARDAEVVAAGLARYAAAWRRASAPLLAARARGAFHLASLALALGVVVGMFVRGLAFRYEATWESTFLDASAMRGVLAVVLGPAAAVLGRAVPGVAEVAAMEAPASGPAGGWIVLYAVTAALFVVLPRALLAALEARTASRLAARLPVAVGTAYASRAGGAGVMPGARVEVLPYSHTPSVRALESLQAALHDVFGTKAQVLISTPLAYGAEAATAPDPVGEAPACRIVLVSLAQTPETEVHGRFVRELLALRRPQDRLVVLADASPYRARVGDPERVDERRRLWTRTVSEAGAPFLAADLDLRDEPGRVERLAAAVRTEPRGG